MLCFYIIQISLSSIVYAVLTYCLHILFFFSIWSYFLKILFHKYFPVIGICFLALLLSSFFFLVLHFIFIFNLFIYFNWRQITLQYCSCFCHTLTWISHGCTCVISILIFTISYLLLLKVSYDVHYLVFLISWVI